MKQLKSNSLRAGIVLVALPMSYTPIEKAGEAGIESATVQYNPECLKAISSSFQRTTPARGEVLRSHATL
jgi:hypothetical protein